MKKNVGKLDRGIRILLALVLVLGYFFNLYNNTFTVIALLALAIAIILLLTAIKGFCPLYQIIGLNSCKIKQNHKK